MSADKYDRARPFFTFEPQHLGPSSKDPNKGSITLATHAASRQSG